MPEKYRNIFACADRLIPYRFHKGVYEAHYRRDGFRVFACAKDFKEMKRKFAAKLLAQMTGEHAPSVPDPRPIHSGAHSKARFADYLHEWLEIKRKTCKESTCKEYERLSSTNLLPVFGERPIANITRQELQGYLWQAPHGGEAVSDPLLHLRSRLRGLAYPFADEEDRPSLL